MLRKCDGQVELLRSKFIYTGIHVADFEKSIKFYRKELGMRLLFKTKIVETGGQVAWLTSKGSKQILELNWYPRKYKHGGKSGLDHLAFEVKDAAVAYGKLSKKGGGAIAPFEEGKWLLAYVKDPNGNWIELGSRIVKKKRNT
jgi:catechol 2,3-dioxygenase-like lactoylglutathione lyase family enzyme